MLRGQRVRLYPNAAQATYLSRACGVARFAWNWALSLRIRYYRRFKKSISTVRLNRHWNRIKKHRFPWVSEVTKHAPEAAFRDLEVAFTNFFEKRAKFPCFKKKGKHDVFLAGRCAGKWTDFRYSANRLILPRIGGVKFRNKLRWPTATLKQVRVIRKAGLWFASILMDVVDPVKLSAERPSCGIDLGCTTFATVSSQGVITEELLPPKPYAKNKRKLKRLSRSVSRKVKRSHNRRKAVQRLGRQHLRIANVRNNFLHQFTTRITQTYGTITLEDLNVRGTLKNHRLAGTIADLGWSEFRRQVQYKAEMTGTRVVIASRWFPSSKKCSHCGYVLEKLELSCREWVCPGCEAMHHRDRNAAMNLEKLGAGCPEVTSGESGEQGTAHAMPSAARRTRNAKKRTAK